MGCGIACGASAAFRRTKARAFWAEARAPGSNAEKTQRIASELGTARPYTDWRALLATEMYYAARIVLDLQTLVSRENNPFEPVVLDRCQIARFDRRRFHIVAPRGAREGRPLRDS